MKIRSIFSTLKQKKAAQPQKIIISFDGGGVRTIAGIVFLKKTDDVQSFLIRLISLNIFSGFLFAIFNIKIFFFLSFALKTENFSEFFKIFIKLNPVIYCFIFFAIMFHLSNNNK